MSSHYRLVYAPELRRDGETIQYPSYAIRHFPEGIVIDDKNGQMVVSADGLLRCLIDAPRYTFTRMPPAPVGQRLADVGESEWTGELGQPTRRDLLELHQARALPCHVYTLSGTLQGEVWVTNYLVDSPDAAILYRVFFGSVTPAVKGIPVLVRIYDGPQEITIRLVSWSLVDTAWPSCVPPRYWAIHNGPTPPWTRKPPPGLSRAQLAEHPDTSPEELEELATEYFEETLRNPTLETLFDEDPVAWQRITLTARQTRVNQRLEQARESIDPSKQQAAQLYLIRKGLEAGYERTKDERVADLLVSFQEFEAGRMDREDFAELYEAAEREAQKIATAKMREEFPDERDLDEVAREIARGAPFFYLDREIEAGEKHAQWLEAFAAEQANG